MLDPKTMPDWLRQIEEDVIDLLGNIDVVRRERLDNLLLAYLRIAHVDALIEEARSGLFALRMSAERAVFPELVEPAFLKGGQDALTELARLHAYRRRFRGQRDQCIAKLFYKGLPRRRARK
jgi:hypothetical protein